MGKDNLLNISTVNILVSNIGIKHRKIITHISVVSFFYTVNLAISTCQIRCKKWVFHIFFSEMSDFNAMTQAIKVVDNNETHFSPEENLSVSWAQQLVTAKKVWNFSFFLENGWGKTSTDCKLGPLSYTTNFMVYSVCVWPEEVLRSVINR